MLTETRMVAARTFFARLNEARADWLSEDQLVKGCEEFFSANDFAVKHDVQLESNPPFTSPIVGSNGQETIVTVLHPKFDKFDVRFVGAAESLLFAMLDNYENYRLAIVTDSMSYNFVTSNEDLGIAIENLMAEGLYLLFVNGRSSYALFDNFKKLTMPIPVSD